MRISEIATVTVMRGEHDLVRDLLIGLSIFEERHVIDTDNEQCFQAEDENVIVHHSPLNYGAPFDAARSVAVKHVKAPWILIVDSDESIPIGLAEELQKLIRDSEESDFDGVWIPRRNHVLGRPLSHSSSWPDYQLRLLRTDAAQFSNKVHQGITPPPRTTRIPPLENLAIQHFNFRSTTEFVNKINLYTSLEGRENAEGGATILRALRSGLREFVARYLKMQGFKDGPEGLHYAILMSFYRYLAVAKIREQEDNKP